MKTGIIDIGSNTIKGFVYQLQNQKIQTEDKKYIYAHLMSYIENGRLTDAGIHILVNSAKELKKFCETYDCGKIYAFATSAVRGAENADEIKGAFYDALQLELDILPEESEAYYDYMSVHLFAGKQNGIGMDLGGGSAQIVVFNGENLLESVSLPAGALRMKNDFVSGLFPTQFEFKAIKNHIKELMAHASITKRNFKRIYLIGGTAITVLSLMRAANFPVKNIIHIKSLYLIKEQLEAMGDELNLFLQKYAKGRETSILPGIAVLQVLGEYFDCEEFKVMKCGVREGYLMEKAGKTEL